MLRWASPLRVANSRGLNPQHGGQLIETAVLSVRVRKASKLASQRLGDGDVGDIVWSQ
jgi:hypothetical protein